MLSQGLKLKLKIKILKAKIFNNCLSLTLEVLIERVKRPIPKSKRLIIVPSREDAPAISNAKYEKAMYAKVKDKDI